MTLNVSAVSAHPGVREAIVAEQRALARELGGVVAEGRDTTTVVFPDADHKFFLNASAAERARRRALQDGELERYDEIHNQLERIYPPALIASLKLNVRWLIDGVDGGQLLYVLIEARV